MWLFLMLMGVYHEGQYGNFKISQLYTKKNISKQHKKNENLLI